MQNDPLFFPIYAVFIGSNFIMAVSIYLKDVIGIFSNFIKFTAIFTPLIASLLSILSSNWVFNNEILAKISIYLLIFSIILLILVISILLIYPIEKEYRDIESLLNKHLREEIDGKFNKFS